MALTRFQCIYVRCENGHFIQQAQLHLAEVSKLADFTNASIQTRTWYILYN
jgi:hypothetical protein